MAMIAVACPWPYIMKWCYVIYVSFYQFSANFDLQAPSQVTGVSLSKVVRQGRPTLRVSWIPAQSNVTIIDYNVQYRRSGIIDWGSQVIVSPPITFVILPALNVGTEYDVRVRAVSAARGEWSEVQTERTFSSEHTIYSYIHFIRYSCLVAHDNILIISAIKSAIHINLHVLY